MNAESGNVTEITVSKGNTVVRGIFRCIRSNTIFSGLLRQGGTTKYEGVSKMFEKSMLKS